MPSLALYTEYLGTNLAKHLLRRATFRYTKEQIDTFSVLTADQAVEQLFNPYIASLSEPIDWRTGQPWINSGIEPISGNSQTRFFVVSWWMNEARLCPSIDYKLQWFLHSIFVTNYNDGNGRELFDYIKLLEYYSRNSLKSFAKKMTLNNLMLKYLNGNTSTATAPNENYAREFLELFTITKGPQIAQGDYTYYTEQDVQEAAKVLTGWRTTTRILGIDPNNLDVETNTQIGYPTYNRHTAGDKTFSSSFGNEVIIGATDVTDMQREFNDFVDMVFDHDQTPISYAKRMYRYFVREEISTEVYYDIIIPLSDHLKDNNYDVVSTVKLLLKSQHFYDKDDSVHGDQILGSIVRPPLDQLIQALSFFNVTIPDQTTDAEDFNKFYNTTIQNTILPIAALNTFAPETVAGYAAYFQEPGYSKNWFDSGTLIARYKLYEAITTGTRVFNTFSNGDVKVNLVEFVKNSGYFSAPQNASQLVTDFCFYLLPLPPSTARYQYYYNLFLDTLSPINWQFEWQNYISSNNDAAVKIPIGRLVKVMLSSQEFQVF